MLKFTEQTDPPKKKLTLVDVPLQHVFQSDGGIYIKLNNDGRCLVLRKSRETQEEVGDIVNYDPSSRVDAWYDEVILAGVHR